MSDAYRRAGSHRSIESSLAPTIAAQFGVFSLRQALAAGASDGSVRRRVAAGRWERLYPGVYRIAGSPRTWRARMMAAFLAAGDGAVVSHNAAAAIQGLVSAPAAQPLEVTVPRGVRRAPAGVIVHEALELAPADVVADGPFAITSVARTLVDLAGVRPRDAVEEALDEALRRGLVSLRDLRRCISRLPGRPGIRNVRELVEMRTDTAAGPECRFETRLTQLFRSAGLRPERQVPVHDAQGRFVARPDFAFPPAKLAVEAESRTYHSGRVRWLRDLERRNRLTALGWRIHHVTWDRTTGDPAGTIAEIRALLDMPR